MFRAFIACQGLQDLRRFLQSKREDIQMWTLKAVWQTFTIKHSTFRCVGPLINYEPAWAPTRFPFIWYVEAASRSRPLTEGNGMTCATCRVHSMTTRSQLVTYSLHCYTCVMSRCCRCIV
jgi:hypothetical protein